MRYLNTLLELGDASFNLGDTLAHLVVHNRGPPRSSTEHEAPCTDRADEESSLLACADFGGGGEGADGADIAGDVGAEECGRHVGGCHVE